MSVGSRHYAIHEPAERLVRVVADDVDVEYGRGAPAALVVGVYRTPDHGDIDALLRANGWRLVSGWLDADDVPSAARRCMVEPCGVVARSPSVVGMIGTRLDRVLKTR